MKVEHYNRSWLFLGTESFNESSELVQKSVCLQIKSQEVSMRVQLFGSNRFSPCFGQVHLTRNRCLLVTHLCHILSRQQNTQHVIDLTVTCCHLSTSLKYTSRLLKHGYTTALQVKTKRRSQSVNRALVA